MPVPVPSPEAWAAMQLTVNGIPRTFDPTVRTVAELVRALGLEGRRIAVEKNGTIVPKSRYAETPVAAGDKLEIVGAVGGG
jgi:sulfur carrier protein